MTAVADRDGGSRRAAMAAARQSRRPTRLGRPAGTAEGPDYPVDDGAGFPDLLRATWRRALQADDLGTAVDVLLTLDDHVPADVSRSAMRTEHEIALAVIRDTTAPAEGRCAFVGELGLTTAGRVVVRIPSGKPLAAAENLVDGVLRVPWSAAAVQDYAVRVADAAERAQEAVADCRRWLADAGPQRRSALLATLREAARRTAPFAFFQGANHYTNFREQNTLTGRTLWPGHPACALTALEHLPLPLWSDSDVVVVVCLNLLVRSAGFARIEEANGTQLTVEHVAGLLERTRQTYAAVPGGRPVPAAASHRVADLDALAGALLARRTEIKGRVQLYREIHGALLHKIERVAEPPGEQARRHELDMCRLLAAQLPLDGGSLGELGAGLVAVPDWLALPRGGFGSGFEALVHATVAAAGRVFGADFAMSRGIRSLPRLIAALRCHDWATITSWEIADYFCCVVPADDARRHFGDSVDHVADVAWSMSARMQYNSWHFIAGNLPPDPAVVARDHFVPPQIPDIARYSDQHHHGHVAAKVRFSIRSPQAVTVLDRSFHGFCDLRLLRCAGPPFGEQEMLAAQRVSAFLARATGLTAELVAAGEDVEVRAFDPRWHWESITGRPAAEPVGPTRGRRHGAAPS